MSHENPYSVVPNMANTERDVHVQPKVTRTLKFRVCVCVFFLLIFKKLDNK